MCLYFEQRMQKMQIRVSTAPNWFCLVIPHNSLGQEEVTTAAAPTAAAPTATKKQSAQ